MRHALLFVVVAIALTACASLRHASVADQFARHKELAPGDQSLAAFIEKVRALSAEARPTPADSAVTLEASDPALAWALALEASLPTADTHRLVGDVYRRLGILDLAFDHYSQAVKVKPNDAAAYEQIARIWRDWGFANLGLTDAYRAIYYAPASPGPYNTLGTILEKLEQPNAAIEQYRRALAGAPDEPFALNNICSALVAAGRFGEALGPCARAVAVDPTLGVARRNLAAILAVPAGGIHQ